MNRIARVLVFIAATSAIVALSSCYLIPRGAFDYVSAAQLKELESLGLPINDGRDPPDITGEYYCDSLVLKDSNISYDTPGDLYADMWLQFASQLIDGTVVVSYDQSGYEWGDGLGAYISGSGNKFSVFAQITGTSDDGIDFKDAMVFSGTMTSSGIQDFAYGLILTWKSPDPYEYLIDVGQGRVFEEDDGLAANYIAAKVFRALETQLRAANSR